LWDTRSRQKLRSFAGVEDDPLSLAVSDEGSLLLAGMRRGDLKLWDLGDGRELHVFGRAHGNDVSSVAFDSTGRRAISAGADRKIKLWDLDRAATYYRLVAEVKMARAALERNPG